MSQIRLWVEVEAVRSEYSWDQGAVRYAKIGRLLKKPPKLRRPDTHMVRVDIDVPLTVFEHQVKIEIL